MTYSHPKLVGLLSLLVLPAYAQVPLSEGAFRETGAAKSTVIVQVNWGRYWKCGSYENAQLQKLAFRRINRVDDASVKNDWELAPSSILGAKPTFEPYAVLLDPGEYALSAFRFKLAKSVTDIKIAEPGPSNLIVDGRPVAGSFTVGAGEVVYIGHFGVDCQGEPSPWRFYIEGKSEFDRYVDGFHQRFPFTKDSPVTFRLFQTTQLGQPYDLPK
jgi:hypothetical protein